MNFKNYEYIKNPICKIISEDNEALLLEDENRIRAKIDKAVIIANQFPMNDQKVELSESLHQHYFLSPHHIQSQERMNKLFGECIEQIFEYRDVVLSKPEYYFLRPRMLSSGAAPGGGFSYCLGTLFESFQSGNHIYWEELAGFKNLYLINISGSALSGDYTATYWSESAKKVLSLSAADHGNERPNLTSTLKKIKKLLHKDIKVPQLNFEDKILENLVSEIKKISIKT